MDETFRNFALGAVLVGCALIYAAMKRNARRAADLSKKWEPLKPEAWNAPKPGTRFFHLDRECVVIDDSYLGKDGWQPGVHAHYLDDEGHFRTLYLTPTHWEAVRLERGNGAT